MQHRNFVICDKEPEYAKRLMERFSMRREADFQLRTFSDVEKLERFSVQKEIRFLLIDEVYPKEVRNRIQAKWRFVLTRGADADLEPGETPVYKYQQADAILAQVLESCIEEQGVRSAGTRAKTKKLIGVYSPVHRIGKTTFALELGRELAREGPALYINMEECAGKQSCFPDHGQQNLADLFYYVKQENNNLGLRIGMMAGQSGELDYILPMPVSQDLREITGEEWFELFAQIFEKSMYEALILDIGESIQNLYGLLRHCDTVYTPYLEEEKSRGKLNQYVANLRELGYEDVLEHSIQKAVKVRAVT